MRNRGVVEGRDGLGLVTYSALMAVSRVLVRLWGRGWAGEWRIKFLYSHWSQAMAQRRQPSQQAEAWC